LEIALRSATVIQNRQAAIKVSLILTMKPHLEAHCDGCRLPAQKMLWSMQTFRVTLDSRDCAALNPAYLYQGTAAH
jgi:hypothetical protein